MKSVLLLPLVLTGCGEQMHKPDTQRYTAVANPMGAGVYVLDTATGELRLCMTGPVKGPGTVGIVCMSPSAALTAGDNPAKKPR